MAIGIVGAPGDDDDGSGSGSAYIFTYAGNTWRQTAKLIADDADTADAFGGSVSLSNTTAVVGAKYDDDGGTGGGSVYVFNLVGGTWQQTAKLTAADGAASDYFGRSVSVGDTLVVGASGDDDRGGASGSAYVFRLVDGLWQPFEKLVPDSSLAAGDFGGSAVATDGQSVLVGASGDDDRGSASGSASMFSFAQEAGPACYADGTCACLDNASGPSAPTEGGLLGPLT